MANSSSKNWQRAIRGHLLTLPPKEAAAFRAPASANDCLDILQKYLRKKSRLTRVVDLFRPLLEPLKRFEGAIDVVVQTNAGIAAPIWGPLRLVITVSRSWIFQEIQFALYF